MNALLEKYNDYIRLRGCGIEYELYDGTSINTSYAEEAFLHLIGLHKLDDIQIIQFWIDTNNKSVKRRDVMLESGGNRHPQSHRNNQSWSDRNRQCSC